MDQDIHKVNIRSSYADHMIDLNKYLAMFPEAKGFECESVTYKKYVNVF